MLLDLQVLQASLNELPSEETVDSSEVNPYLLNEVLRPLLSGKVLHYGDIDFSEFDADDLRVISDYCDKRDHAMCGLQKIVTGLVEARASACKSRAFF